MSPQDKYTGSGSEFDVSKDEKNLDVENVDEIITPEKKSRKRFSRRTKILAGSLALVGSLVVAQNADAYGKWRTYDSDNFYPTPPPGCEDYVDMDRDLSVQLPPENDDAISDFWEARGLDDNGDDFVFDADVTSVTSDADRFDSDSMDIVETLRWLRDFYDNHIESFELPSSGLKINIYSSEPEPGFIIDYERFDELFHAGFDKSLIMADRHYQELLDCTRNAFGLPEAVKDKELDVFILPELDYCLVNMRYEKIGEGISELDCNANGATPPKIEIDFLLWDLLNEEVMILAPKEFEYEENTVNHINRIIFHEGLHYWTNQTGKNFELHPEERFVMAVDETARAYDIADIMNPDRPAIIYKK